MSSSPAAPSRASVTAWARTSASEWPARALSKGISTPPRTSPRPVLAGTKAWASTPSPTLKAMLASRSPHPPAALRVVGALPCGQYRLRKHEVLRGGQLDVGPLPHHQRDQPSGFLESGGVVRCPAQDLIGGG